MNVESKKISRRGWGIEDYVNEAKQYPSRLKLKLSDRGLYNAFSKFPGELDKIFPPRVRIERDFSEASIRSEATQYSSKKDFSDHDPDMYMAAVRMGIISDLGFPHVSGFNDNLPAQLYMGHVRLTDGSTGAMFGITTRHIYSRFSLTDLTHLSDTLSLRFDIGLNARRLEKHLKDKFKPFSVACGLSPLRDKVGTSGEVLAGVSVQDLLDALLSSGEDVPTPTEWPALW